MRPQEALAAGRWLSEGEMDVCLLSAGTADSLGIAAVDVGRTRCAFLAKTFTLLEYCKTLL